MSDEVEKLQRKYEVTIQFIGSTTIEVEANDPEEAEELALNQAPQNDFGFAKYDANEWYVDDPDKDIREVKD